MCVSLRRQARRNGACIDGRMMTPSGRLWVIMVIEHAQWCTERPVVCQTATSAVPNLRGETLESVAPWRY